MSSHTHDSCKWKERERERIGVKGQIKEKKGEVREHGVEGIDGGETKKA